MKRKVKIVVPKKGGHLVAVTIGRNSLCPCGSGKKIKNCHPETMTKYLSKPNSVPTTIPPFKVSAEVGKAALTNNLPNLVKE